MIKKIILLYLFLVVLSVELAYCQISGTYTIGTGGDFTTITDAVNSLVSVGVSGPVTFNIKDGTYNEIVSIGAFSGASATNSVIFQSLSQDTAKVKVWSYTDHSIGQGIITLDDCQYVTIKNITIEAKEDIDIPYAVATKNNASNIHIDGCKLILPEISSSGDASSGMYIRYNIIPGPSNIEISNCSFSGGTNGLYIEKDSILNIYNNEFTDQYGNGIFIQNAADITISKNSMLTTQAKGYTGIYLGDIKKGCTIQSNYIRGYLRKEGIYFYSYDGKGETALITNNMIYMGNWQNGDVHALVLAACKDLLIYNNTFIINNDRTSSPTVWITSGARNISLKNNILYNHGGGYALRIDQIDSVLVSDYNAMYTMGNVLILHSPDTSSTLSEWQTTSRMDANSISASISFASIDADFHIPCWAGSMIADKGISLPEVTTDFDGTIRSSTPDIGADEFDLCLDIDQIHSRIDFDIYPNPSTGNFTIMPLHNIQQFKIDIFDLQGRKIMAQGNIYNSNKQNIISTDLSPGSYILYLYSDNFYSTKKIIIE